MIRILFGSALSVLGLGAAATVLGPELVTGPRGEPLVVAAPQDAALQQASFDGAACASTLILDEEDLLHATPAQAATGGVHVVTLAFRSGVDGPSMVMEPGETDTGDGMGFVLVFDGAGRILSVTPTRAEREWMLSDVYADDCLHSDTRPSGV